MIATIAMGGLTPDHIETGTDRSGGDDIIAELKGSTAFMKPNALTSHTAHIHDLLFQLTLAVGLTRSHEAGTC